LDFFRYCEQAHEPGTRAVLNGSDARSWRCVVFDPVFDLVEIDVDAACSAVFDVPAVARTDDLSSPYEWQCYAQD
jgi:hypothetical protein